MAVDERARHHLYGTLEDALGSDATGTLMSLLPPVGWADVATRHDLDALGNRLDSRIDRVRVEMADLRTELRTEMADLRTEMADLRSELTSDMAALESGLRIDMADLHTGMADLRAGLRSDMAANQRQLLFALVGTMLTMVGLAWAALALA